MPFANHDGESSLANASDVSYVDDGVVHFSATTPSKSLQVACDIADTTHNVLSARGLVANFSAGKSEFLIAFWGPGSAQARIDLFGRQRGVITTKNGLQVQVVDTYKHVGTNLHSKCSLGPELAYRVACASTTRKEMRHILGSTIVSNIESQFPLADSLVVSQLLQNAGTWPEISHKLLKHYERSTCS